MAERRCDPFPSLSFAPAVPIVFIVDDDVSVRESLESLIQSTGWEPGVLAPSCLVLDVALPDLNGLELQRLIADRTHLPIIFITGHADVATSVRAMKAGAEEFLTKPFDASVMLDAIEHAIDRSIASLDYEARMRDLRDTWRN